MKVTKLIYYKCGIWHDDGRGEDVLFIATPMYFASSAWCLSDEAYNNVSGTKFSAITGDDCKEWTLARQSIRRIDNSEYMDYLLSRSCDEFREMFTKKFIDANNEETR